MTESWRDRANCRGTDPEAFFPDDPKALLIVQRICDRCPVRLPCLEYAVPRPELIGYWGGASKAERARIRADRLREAS